MKDSKQQDAVDQACAQAQLAAADMRLTKRKARAAKKAVREAKRAHKAAKKLAKAAKKAAKAARETLAEVKQAAEESSLSTVKPYAKVSLRRTRLATKKGRWAAAAACEQAAPAHVEPACAPQEAVFETSKQPNQN